MKTTRVTQTLARCLLAGLVFISGAAAAYTLRFSPSAQSVALGNTATVEVRIAGILPNPPSTNGQPDGLGDYDFDIVCDPLLVGFRQANDALSLGSAVGLGVDSTQAGRLKVSDL